MKKAADHCRQILNYVNQAVKEAENKQVKKESKKMQNEVGRVLVLHGIYKIIIGTSHIIDRGDIY